MSEPLFLNCYLLGSDSSGVFTVEIPKTRNVSFLKGLIKKEQSPRLDQVNASDLTVWKVSVTLPADAVTPELTVADAGGQELRSVEIISSIFDKPLMDEDVQILVQAPVETLFMSEPLFLNCYLLGSDSSAVFTVEIPKTRNVSLLKGLIKKEQSLRLDHVDASDLTVWKVSVTLPADAVTPELTVADAGGQELRSVKIISSIFDKPLMNEDVHILVQAPMAIRQKRPLPESDDIFSDLKRTKIVTTAPSNTAKPEVYEPLQQNPFEKIFDDRPTPDPDIPSVALLYEGFGHFLDITDGRNDVPGLADIIIKKLYSEVDTFASKMNEYYENEDSRRDAILPCLGRIFSARRGTQIPELQAGAIGSVRTDGHNIAPHGAGTIVVKCKNNVAGINGNPQVELACCIAHLYSTKVDEQLYLRWRIPCLGLTIVGCKLTFYAVIAIDHRFKLVSLTPTFSCIQSASDGRDRRSLYLAFIAASVLQAHIVQDGEKFQNNIRPEIPSKARRFPVVTKLRKYLSDDHFNFKIKDVFPEREPYRLLYIAATPDGKLVLIKFVRRYSIELHHHCADLGHAPRILAFERLPGGWYAVAMEYIESGHSITQAPQLAIHRDRWIRELHGLVESFHLKGYVHGDLRDANIFCKGETMTLLDFDWGGKEGEVFYPTGNLNSELQDGRDDLIITKEDDVRVLKKTLAKLYK